MSKARNMRVSGYVHDIAGEYSEIKGCSLVDALEELVRALVEPETINVDHMCMINMAISRVRIGRDTDALSKGGGA